MDSSYSFQRLLDKCNEKEDEAPRSDYKVESLILNPSALSLSLLTSQLGQEGE
ncbi:UNVERIFIED_CONTAM: hypothetical protein FKN15_020692 [Acipenser sinensis]